MTCIPTGENSVTSYILTALGKEYCNSNPDAEFIRVSTKGVYYYDLSYHMMKIHLWTDEEKEKMQNALIMGVYGLMEVMETSESETTTE